MTYWALAIVATYLLGGVPFGLLIGLAKGVDVRRHGSKNIGASNVGRTLGRKYGVTTFALDMLKGFLPVLIAGFALGTIGTIDLSPGKTWPWLAFGVVAVLGHTYSPYLKFRGGKGVATGFGAVLAMYPILTIPAILSIGTWGASVLLTRYIGFSSCMAGLSLLPWAMLTPWFGRLTGMFRQERKDGELLRLWPYLLVAAFMGVLVVWRHRSNLVRMLAGTEPRVKTRTERAAARASKGTGSAPAAAAPQISATAPIALTDPTVSTAPTAPVVQPAAQPVRG